MTIRDPLYVPQGFCILDSHYGSLYGTNLNPPEEPFNVNIQARSHFYETGH